MSGGELPLGSYEHDCLCCENTGFSGNARGYDDICSDCGGQSVYARTGDEKPLDKPL